MKFDESLLTAYLDGELTEEELAVVERQLAQSAAHRETLRELTRMQQQLAALPAESFSTDVVAEVRRRIAAEHPVSSRAMQESRQATDHGAGAAGKPGADVEASTPSGDRFDAGASLAWRLWVPLALAAGLLIIVGFVVLRRPVQVAVSERAERVAEDASKLQRSDAPGSSSPEPSSPEASLAQSRESLEEEALAAPEEAPAAESSTAEPRTGRGNPPADSPAAPRGRSEPAVEEAPAGVQPMIQRQRAGGFGGGMGGAGVDADSQLQRQPDDQAWGFLEDRLPEETRLYRFYSGGVEVLERRRNLSRDAGGERLSFFDSQADAAAAPLVAFEVPPGEVETMLRWMAEQVQAEEVADEVREKSGAGAAAYARAEPRTPERPVAVLVEAPAERIGALLEATRRRIAQRYGGQTVLPKQLESESSDAFADGVVIILIEPADRE